MYYDWLLHMPYVLFFTELLQMKICRKEAMKTTTTTMEKIGSKSAWVDSDDDEDYGNCINLQQAAILFNLWRPESLQYTYLVIISGGFRLK